MRKLEEFVNEKLKVSNKSITAHTLFPKSKEGLREMIKDEIERHGPECSLNHIDISNVPNLIELFDGSEFDGDISEWDVSKITHFDYMFYYSKFTGNNGDISGWDVSNAGSLFGMFEGSEFCSDISNWEINPGCHTGNMFNKCDIDPKYKPKGV